jgi:RHS repeat-associated protein
LFSVVALSDASANYKEGYQYDPYGRHVRLTDGNDADTYVNFNTNDTRSALATSNYGNPYLFTGQRLDSESGLYYYKNRYYSTSQGRFISRDPIGHMGGTNLYCYVLGLPTKAVDPTGLNLTQIEFGWETLNVTVSIAFDPGVGPGGYVPSPITGTGPGGLPTIKVDYTVKALVFKACVDGKFPTIDLREVKLGRAHWGTLLDLPFLLIPYFYVSLELTNEIEERVEETTDEPPKLGYWHNVTRTLTYERGFWLGVRAGFSAKPPKYSPPMARGIPLGFRLFARDTSPDKLVFKKSCEFCRCIGLDEKGNPYVKERPW